MMELKDTIKLMTSKDYKERFAAEYLQTKIRYQKLHKMLVKLEAGKLGFEPTCPACLLDNQAKCMGEYLRSLEIRAEIEGVDLDKYLETPKPAVNVKTGELLARGDEVYEVVCSDEDTFVIAPREYKDGHHYATNYDKMEAYSNDPTVTNLLYMEFKRYSEVDE